MFPPVRRRTDSHGSGTESQEESREMEREGRRPTGYPPFFEDLRRQPYFDQRMFHDYEKMEEYRRCLLYPPQTLFVFWSVAVFFVHSVFQ